MIHEPSEEHTKESLKQPKKNQRSLKSKKELVIWTCLTERQIEIYQAFLNSSEVSSVLNRSHSPLAALQVLKKICDHPDLLSNSLKGCESLPLEDISKYPSLANSVVQKKKKKKKKKKRTNIF